jgi:hypothetical protein
MVPTRCFHDTIGDRGRPPPPGQRPRHVLRVHGRRPCARSSSTPTSPSRSCATGSHVTTSRSRHGARSGLAGVCWPAPRPRGLAGPPPPTPTQIVLRWHIQRGEVPIPRSTDTARIAQNLDVFEFTLGDDDMAAAAALDRDRGPVSAERPTRAAAVPTIAGQKFAAPTYPLSRTVPPPLTLRAMAGGPRRRRRRVRLRGGHRRGARRAALRDPPPGRPDPRECRHPRRTNGVPHRAGDDAAGRAFRPARRRPPGREQALAVRVLDAVRRAGRTYGPVEVAVHVPR